MCPLVNLLGKLTSVIIVIVSSVLLLTCVHSDVCIYTYINIFSLAVIWFAECRFRDVDQCSSDNCKITYSLLNNAWSTTILYYTYIYITLYYIIILYYIILYYILHLFQFLWYLHFLWGYVDVKDRWNRKLLERLYFIICFWCIFPVSPDLC